ncbi:hypothetical protein D0868_05146 [Hortaea werneckii]|uniref:Fungal N-terminal domain-containing protein n=1 Tax=Hortaea werneckii TaxID=91943 RepID=A0A3M6YYI0_HORWE|nr:hypothetical protein D0868_05146 [Hortaea werneckii]
MPTGVEEASAILAFVQVGFSLAKTCTTLVGEYREAPDELATLANAIVDTLAHIETIKSLLEENETTHGWNANGIDLAKSCLDEAERLLCVESPGLDLLAGLGRLMKVSPRPAENAAYIDPVQGLCGEQRRLARDRAVVLVRGRQAQRAQRKYLGQHTNMPSHRNRASRDGQNDNSVAQDPTSGVETSQEARVENDSKTTAKAVPKLPGQLDSLDEVDNASHSENTREKNRDAQGTADIPLKDTKEASDPLRESINATDSSRASHISRPTNEGSTPTAMKNQNSITVDQTAKHVEKDEDRENEGPGTTHQHTLSAGREVELHAGNHVDEDFNLAQRAQSVAIHRSGKIAKGIKIRFWKTVFGRLILRKKVADPLCHSTQESSLRNADSKLVEVSKLWRMGKWSLTKRTGLQTHPIASTKFVSFIVTLAAEAHSIVLAHLNRDELNSLSRHATTHDDRPEANLTSQIYASLPTYTHRDLDRRLELKRIESRCHSRGHEIIYAEILGMKIFKARRMIRQKLLDPGASLTANKILLVFQEREEAEIVPEFDGSQRTNKPVPVINNIYMDQESLNKPLDAFDANFGESHGHSSMETIMRREDRRREWEREREESREALAERWEREKKEFKRREEEKRKRIEEEEQQRREDDADDDEEVDLFGNSLGLSDNELVQRLLEMYTNTHSSLEARSEEAADEAQGHGVPP